MRVLYGGSDITGYVSSVVWGGSKSEVSRKVELSIINAPQDKNIPTLVMGLAGTISLIGDSGAELFRGYIIDREASSVTGTVKYTAYDIMYYTTKSTATYNFSDKTAETITSMVCSDVGIPTGSLASTGISQKLIVQNKSIYDIIMEAYTNAHQQNGKLYHAIARGGSVCVEEMGRRVCGTPLTEFNNITSSKYTETLSNMVNRVKIYTDKGEPDGVVQNSDVKYGIFQKSYTKEQGKDPTTTAKSMFHGIDKTYSLECISCEDAVTGSGVIISDSATGLQGLAWIEADTHTWTNGVATMSLTITLKQVMDKKGEGSK